MKKKTRNPEPRKRGPKPETLKLEGPWEKAVGKAVRKPPVEPSPVTSKIREK